MRLGLLLALGLEASPDLTTQAATLRTQADGLRATGQPAAALLAYQQAALLDPADPWAPFGRCATLAELQQRAEAFACLWSLPPAADPLLQRLARQVYGGLLRAEAQAKLQAGALDEARAAAASAVQVEPDLWGHLLLGGVALAQDQPADALAAFEAALRFQPGQTDAERGRLAALFALGRFDEVEALARGLRADPEAAAWGRRSALTRAEAEARAGDLGAARRRLDRCATELGADAGLRLAQGAYAAQAGDPAAAFAFAAQSIQTADTFDLGAARLLVDAARSTGQSGVAAALLQDRPGAAPLVAAARLDAALHAAEVASGAARAAALRQVARSLKTEPVPEGWRRLGEALLADQQPRAALEAFAAAGPDEADARRGAARAHLALGAPAAALDAIEGLETPADGLLRAEAALQTGDPYGARAIVDGLPAGAPTWVQVSAARLRATALREAGPGVQGSLVLAQRGRPDEVAPLQVLALPLRLSQPWGRLRLSAGATAIQLADGAGEDRGLSVSAGLSTPSRAAWSGQAEIGLSPIGFLGGAYPVGEFRLDRRLGAGLILRGEGRRIPRADSRTAWASTVYEPTQQRVGRLSDVQGGLSLLASQGAEDAGLRLVAGYLEGYGIAPVPTTEANLWLGHRLAPGPADLRLGLDALSLTAARSLAAVEPGQGGAFTPRSFVSVGGRLDGALEPGALRLCGALGLGARVQSDPTLPAAAEAWAPTARGGLGLRAPLPQRGQLLVDASLERVSDDWQKGVVQVGLAYGAETPGEPALPGGRLAAGGTLPVPTCSPFGVD